MVVVESYDDYVMIKNEKLNKDIEKLSTNGAVVIEKPDGDYDITLENDK